MGNLVSTRLSLIPQLSFEIPHMYLVAMAKLERISLLQVAGLGQVSKSNFIALIALSNDHRSEK